MHTSDPNDSRIKALFAGVTSGYDTHRPVLCEAVRRTRGPILELGTGDGSTIPLHAVATDHSRQLFSFDNNRQWIAKYVGLRNEHHLVALVASWDECPIESQFWSVAFVDHAPAERRVVEIGRLRYRAILVVVHDSEDPTYGYDSVFDSFAHRFDYREHKQWTTVLSNYLDIADWRILA
jgi:hypothetical protein